MIKPHHTELFRREHQADMRLGRTERSILAEHSIATGHEIDWKGVQIMEMEKYWHRRKMKEAWNIKFGILCLNRDEGFLVDSYIIVIEDRRLKKRSKRIALAL